MHCRTSSTNSLPKPKDPSSPITPNPSHFRLVSLSTIGNKYLDPVHKHMFLPQWKFTSEYERLFQSKKVPYHTEDIAYTLPHMLEKVNNHSGLQYTVAYTETGRVMRSLADLPDYLSVVVLATDRDPRPERVTKPRPSPPRNNLQPLMILASPSLPRIKVIPSSRAQAISLPQGLVLSGFPTSNRASKPTHSHLSLGEINAIALSGESLLPSLTERSRIRSLGKTRENSNEHSPELSNIDDFSQLFSPTQLEVLKREYEKLKHQSLVERVNDAVQTSSRLPGNVKDYLSQIRSKALVTTKFQEIFAKYLQSALPVLQGKPANVFRSVLRGLGSDGRSLSWSQWLLLNSLLIHNLADNNTKVSFVSRVPLTQMFGSRPDYMDALVTLTSLCQGDERNRQFHTLFQQLKAVFADGNSVTPSVIRRKCLMGVVNYELVISCLRERQQ